MAAPITHILLAIQILPSLPDKNEKEFIIGTCFHDIHYLNCLKRSNTYPKTFTFDDIKNEKSSFRAGLMFHMLVESNREKLMREKGVYKLVDKSIITPQALQFGEDVLFYNKVKEPSKIALYFDDILQEEIDLLKNKQEHLQTWHKAIKNYILNFNEKENRFKFLKRCGKRRFSLYEKGMFTNIKRAALMKVNMILYKKLERIIEQANANEDIKEIREFFINQFSNFL